MVKKKNLNSKNACRNVLLCDLSLPCVNCPHRPNRINKAFARKNRKRSLNAYKTDEGYRTFLDRQDKTLANKYRKKLKMEQLE